jgi:hypothetical protein
VAVLGVGCGGSNDDSGAGAPGTGGNATGGSATGGTSTGGTWTGGSGTGANGGASGSGGSATGGTSTGGNGTGGASGSGGSGNGGSGNAPGTLLFDDGFESGTILTSGPSHWEPNTQPGCTHAVKTASGGYDGSTYYVESKIIAAPNQYRAELHARANGDPIGKLFDIGDTIYYGISVRLPSGFVLDDLTGDTLMQWHFGAGPDDNHAGHYGLHVDFDKWGFVRHAGESVSGAQLQGGGDLGLVTGDIGKWVRWVIRINWQTNTTGSIKVWKNPDAESDKPLLDQSNIRTWNPDGFPPKNPIGLYKPQWRPMHFSKTYDPNETPNVSPRIFHHHDDLRIATSFDLVK